MEHIKFIIGATLHNWTYLMISTPDSRDELNQDSLNSTLAQFHKHLQTAGITAAKHTQGSWLKVHSPNDVEIESAMKNLAGDPTRARLILVILPFRATLLYNQIKHIGDVKLGVHTVCVIGENLPKRNHSTLGMWHSSLISSSVVSISWLIPKDLASSTRTKR